MFELITYHHSFQKINIIQPIQTDRDLIARLAEERKDENEVFRTYLQSIDSKRLDELAAPIYHDVNAEIDCTTCGACCGNLMVNVTNDRAVKVAERLNISITDFEEKYVEKSSGGLMIMNTIPCHFLCENKCTIYEDRFDECRDFPALHRPGLQSRLFAMMMHYGMCPIIFNVMERLKSKTGFEDNE